MKKIFSILSAILLIISTAPVYSASAATDVTKPVFESISVDKKTATAGDTVKVSVRASDDVGIGSVSLSYLTPVTKKATPVKLVLNNQTYAYEGTVDIDNNFDSGSYTINALTITDTSNNTITLKSSTAPEKMAAGEFTVSGTVGTIGPDLQKPVFESISIDKTKILTGNTVSVSVKASDNRGINFISLKYHTPANKEIQVSLTNNADTNAFEGKITLSNLAALGVYSVSYLSIVDLSGNTLNVNLDSESQKMASGAFKVVSELNPPMFTKLSIDQSLVASGDTVHFTVDATDESGLASATLYYKAPKSQAKVAVPLQIDGTHFIGAFSVAGTTEEGNWTVDSLEITDINDNVAVIGAAALSAGNFTVKDIIPPAKPVVNTVTDKDLTVTGSAEAGSKVDVKANGAVIGSAVAGADGTFTVTIAKQTAGTELTVTATDAAGNVSDAASTVVKDVTAPAKPVVNTVTDKDLTVTGSAEAGSKVDVKANGAVIGSAVAGVDGTFTVTIAKQTAGTELTVTATDAAGNVSDTASTVVKDVTAPAKPMVNPVTDKDLTVTGSAEAGSKVDVKANGAVIASAVAGVDGAFTVTIAKQAAGIELTVTATDDAGNVSDAASTVVKDVTAPAKPVVNSVTDKDLTVTGSAEAGSKVDVKANGAVIASAVTGVDGTFTVTIAKQTAGTELTVTATDAAGNVSDAASLVVKDVTAPAKPVVNPVTDKDLTVTGSAEAGSKVDVKANGAVIGSAVAGVDGTFTVSIAKQTAGTELTVTATDAAGNVSDAASLVVKDVTAPAKPVVNPVTDKDLTVTGSAEAGSKVDVKANGAVIASAVTGTDGKFTVTIAKQAAGIELTVTATDAAGNVSDAASLVVKDVTAPAKPVVNPVTDKDLTVTGSAEAGSKVDVKANGAVIASAVTGTDGKFTVTIAKQAAGIELTVTATDAAGNVSDAASLVVKDVTAPAKPVVHPVSETATSLSGHTEPGVKIEVTANGKIIGSGVAGTDGHFTIIITGQLAGTTLTITATDVAGNVSDQTTIVVSKKLSGWVKDNGTWYYYDPATFVVKTGWYKVNGIWYYSDMSGAMQTGWVKDGATWYYLDSGGAMQTGWLKTGTTWYYLNTSGAMQTGWLKLGTSWYYLQASGAMKTGWLKDGANWYYLNANGVMKTGWLKNGAAWYYLNASGIMQTGWVKLGTTWYYFNTSGVMVTGWVQISGKSYYFDPSGAWKK
ncbi:hypothetical protein FAY30_24500 [Bacillus sp. S3]|uniref:Ig-like domain-containing protein n=1 Tax=Bacillus sp. S3 TaxID=486398 RepID=UPI00118CEA45|nr:Ig-like domain-containing protein [Bacillus sp. S3]QCJ44790.1 hypothetical protein FAY30_24500 [Bacillus sp. S3]